MKKIVLVALMALCSVSFGVESCVGQCQANLLSQCLFSKCKPLHGTLNPKYKACKEDCKNEVYVGKAEFCKAKCKK